jgi:hypothetical protein
MSVFFIMLLYLFHFFLSLFFFFRPLLITHYQVQTTPRLAEKFQLEVQNQATNLKRKNQVVLPYEKVNKQNKNGKQKKKNTKKKKRKIKEKKN